MSILIKGMAMPKNCEECAFNYDMYRCMITLKSTMLADTDRLSDCPLVELPPHGRLIDADALEELFREVIGNIFKREEITHVLEHMVRASAMVVEMIKDAPTIIEADSTQTNDSNALDAIESEVDDG